MDEIGAEPPVGSHGNSTNNITGPTAAPSHEDHEEEGEHHDDEHEDEHEDSLIGDGNTTNVTASGDASPTSAPSHEDHEEGEHHDEEHEHEEGEHHDEEHEHEDHQEEHEHEREDHHDDEHEDHDDEHEGHEDEHEDHDDEHEDHEDEHEDHDDEHEDHDDEHEDHEDHDDEHEDHDDHEHDEHDEHDHGDENESAFSASDDHDDESKPWGEAIGAALLVNAFTLIGVVVVLLLATMATDVKNKLLHLVFPSFAVGTLLATTVFLLLPESLHLLEASGGAGWKFGTSILAGYVLVHLLHNIFPHSHSASNVVALDDSDISDTQKPIVHATATPKKVMDDDDDEEIDSDMFIVEKEVSRKVSLARTVDASLSTFEEGSSHDEERAVHVQKLDAIAEEDTDRYPIDWQLATSLLLGDFFHNFVDGVFIGNAFLLCDKTVAWVIVASTIFHEWSQEVGDFVLLTHQCNMSTVQALSLNFVSGLSIVLGAVLVLVLDVSETATGALLGISAGVYIAVSAAQVQSRINDHAIHGMKDRLLSIACFAVGAVLIGLVLLRHEHCEAGHDDGDNDGHNH